MGKTTNRYIHKDESQMFKLIGKSFKSTLESIAIAFIMAFIFRAFIVEAYRIPTGSMAPTLYGEHRTRICNDCGYEYAYEIRDFVTNGRRILRAPRINVCPNCRWSEEPYPLFYNGRPVIDGGDRILVMKLGYELAEIFPSLKKYLGPHRWDVVVFKNPADPKINFIKRLIGLPGEKLEIIDGDIYINDKIIHKTPAAQRSLWFNVYDNDYLPTRRERVSSEDVPCWEPTDRESEQLWNTSGRLLIFHGYNTRKAGNIRFTGSITDFYAYDDPDRQHAWSFIVSDLKLRFVLVVRHGSGKIRAILSKRDNVFIAEIDTQGKACLYRCPLKEFTQGKQKFNLMLENSCLPIKPKTPAIISFENVDYRLRLKINRKIILQTTDKEYSPPKDKESLKPETIVPIVQLSASGMDCQLWHVKLFRDVYYRSVKFTEPRNSKGEINPLLGHLGHGVQGNPIQLGHNEYFVLGDNSPESKDSRLWWEVGPHLKNKYKQGKYHLGTVPSDQMVGRAFFVYWPSGFRIFKGGMGIIPNVGRMRMIR